MASKFDLSSIVSPKETYNGLTYGSWAATWCNWLFSDQHQIGSVYFLRGNVDKEPNIVRTGKNGITVYNDVAIFFPIICTFSSKLLNSDAMNEMQRRKDSTEPERDPSLLKLKINDMGIPNLHEYYAESPEFNLEISRRTPLMRYFDPPVRMGRSEAVIAGYWILVKPLKLGTYAIIFNGKHRDGFVTSGHYTIKIVKRQP
jgi:hypothetical protein